MGTETGSGQRSWGRAGTLSAHGDPTTVTPEGESSPQEEGDDPMTRPPRASPAVRALLVWAPFLACAATAGAQEEGADRHEVRSSFEVAVPLAPAVTTLEGRPHLVYELHLTNFARGELNLTAIEVLDPEAPDEPIAGFRGEELGRILGGPGVASDTDRHRVAPGRRVVAYFRLPLDPSAAVPSRVIHRVAYREGEAGSEAIVAGDAVAVDTRSPVALGPPFRDGVWIAIYDPLGARSHQRVLLALDGEVRMPARFAIDWFMVDEKGRAGEEDSERVASWHGYGAEVLAVADATVVAARDSIEESPTLRREFDPGLDGGSGNYVSLDLGDGRHVHYEHLKPGSVAVAVGQRVREGDVVARAGYTGHATGPHLHMHVSDGRVPLAGEGVPWVFRSYELLGAYPLPFRGSLSSFTEGELWTPVPAGTPKSRSMEMPAPFAVVDFGRRDR